MSSKVPSRELSRAKKIERLAIANRGEVAVRIIRACEDLGIEAVLLYSEPDRQSKAYRLARKKICIGPAAASESYLNIPRVVEGALALGAQAIHPGFGFLSENAQFVRATEAAGLIFVGPPADAMELLGDKVKCKAHAQKLSIVSIPGYQESDQTFGKLKTEALKIGLPVLIKAAAGGGGRGMKLISHVDEIEEQINSAKMESQAAFGSDQIFLEKYLDHAKHIEVQVFADSTGHVSSLFDRECTVQRRHQKIIEEAISPSLSLDLRRRICQTACAMIEGTNYRGAATVEFLLQDGVFYFLEVNTRLQVEHPVTELVLGVDLVKAQIITAQGQAIGWKDSLTLAPRGHAIECRIYAEDPFRGGIPSTGTLGTIQFPEGPGRRFDDGFEKGDEITSHYDPMIAKVIVWDETRPRAIEKMKRTLKDTIIFGVQTNFPFLIEMLSHPDFVTGTMTTKFIEQHFPQGLLGKDPFDEKELEIKILVEKKIFDIRHSVVGTSVSPFARPGRFP